MPKKAPPPPEYPEELRFPAEHPLVKEWTDNVHAHGEEIDSSEEFCWRSLALGWALAKGLTREQAYYFTMQAPL